MAAGSRTGEGVLHQATQFSKLTPCLGRQGRLQPNIYTQVLSGNALKESWKKGYAAPKATSII